MTIRNLVILCLSLLYAGSTACAQDEIDVVYLNNGSKILGTILEMVPNEHVKLRLYDGSEIVYSSDEIKMIRKEARRTRFGQTENTHMDSNQDTDSYQDADTHRTGGWGAVSEEDLELLHTPYWEMGSVLGTPGGVNVALGVWAGLLGARVSAGYFIDGLGIQGNVGVKIHDNRTYNSVLALVGGVSDMRPNRKEEYYGAVWEWNYRGIFIQLGLAVHPQGLTDPNVIGQVGYMHRFLPD